MFNKLKSIFSCLSFNSVYIVGVYFGIVKGVESAYNVMIVIATLIAIVAALSLKTPAFDSLRNKATLTTFISLVSYSYCLVVSVNYLHFYSAIVFLSLLGMLVSLIDYKSE